MILLFLLFLFADGLFNAHGGTNYQTMFGEIGAVLWFSYEINQRLKSIVPAIAFFYFAAYSIYCQFMPPPFMLTGFDAFPGILFMNSARSPLFLILAVVPMIFMTHDHVKSVFNAFRIFAVADVFFMVYTYYFTMSPTGHYHIAGGFIGQNSIDGTFLALMLPNFLLSKKIPIVDKRLSIGVILFGCIISTSSTVYGVLCIEFLVWLLYKYRWTARSLIFTGLVGLVTIPIGWVILGDQLFNGNGRYNVLILSRDNFLGALNHVVPHKFLTILFGFGTGVFESLMPRIQNTREVFIWLHCLPGQVLIEQGVVGLTLLIWMYVIMLKRNRKDKIKLMTLAGAGLQSFVQPTERYFLFAVFFIFLIRSSFEDKDESNM